jgi:malate dehydrogenase (oxaloacetate-decarboxylating)
VRAREITDAMKMAAARGIAEIVRDDDLRPDYIVPSAFNRDVAEAVATAVAHEAQRTGESRVEGGEVGYAPGDTAEFRPVKA